MGRRRGDSTWVSLFAVVFSREISFMKLMVGTSNDKESVHSTLQLVPYSDHSQYREENDRPSPSNNILTRINGGVSEKHGCDS